MGEYRDDMYVRLRLMFSFSSDLFTKIYELEIARKIPVEDFRFKHISK